MPDSHVGEYVYLCLIPKGWDSKVSNASARSGRALFEESLSLCASQIYSNHIFPLMSTATQTAEPTPLVSVIIPVYKVEDYLAECVDSVINQTYRNLEIILVDDGSPDGCGAMCDAYAAQDDRVRVIHRPNGGLSAARNSGMDIATGEFITFLDSDDWMYRGTIEGYMQCFAKHPELDLVESGIYYTSSGEPCNVGEYIGDLQATAKILTGSELIRTICMDTCPIPTAIAWNKCYRKELVEGHRFIEGRVWEDYAFHLRLFPHVKFYLRWDQVNYYYREDREGAITERKSALIIPKLVDSYENQKEIIVDLEAKIARGETMSGGISLEDHRLYALSQFVSQLIAPSYCDLRIRSVRTQLIPVIRPYVKFIAMRPYMSASRLKVLARRIMIFSLPIYMYLYVPLVYMYLDVKRSLGMHR